MSISRDFAKEIAAPSEERHREFKRSELWDTLKYRIARAALAMANIRDGGLIIIGVEEGGLTHSATGVQVDHLPSYKDDEIKEFINKYADPYVSCSIFREHISGKQFIIIEVESFDLVPVVCKKTYTDTKDKCILQEGGVYTRPYGKTESCLVRSQNEMREMLELATERGIRKFLARANHAHVSLAVQPTDDEQFAEERREFETQISSAEFYSHGYYLLSIRPKVYDANGIQPISRLLELVNKNEVRWYGWSFPLTYREEQPVEQRCAGSPNYAKGWGEFWRMYQSGLFLYAIPYWEDRSAKAALELMDRRTEIFRPHEFEPKGVVNFHHLITHVSLGYEFAARLAKTLDWDPAVEIRVTLTHTADRVIVSTDTSRPIGRFWRTTSPDIESRRTIQTIDLLSKPRQLAAEAAFEILQRFAGSEISVENVIRVQEDLFGG